MAACGHFPEAITPRLYQRPAQAHDLDGARRACVDTVVLGRSLTAVEALSGLGRACFYAGARALLVSNWPVETVSARLLTTGIFRWQAADPALARAAALQRTMLDLIDTGGVRDAGGKLVFSYAHPMFWAPFTLVGDGGR